MAKQFLDASGLNQYTQALKNCTLIVGKAVHATNADNALTANVANEVAWDDVTGKPTEFTPADHDGAKVTSLATYVKAGNTGDIETTDNLVQALAKLENKAEAGADEPIPSSVIDTIIEGTF